jgi:transposase-like protein
VWFTELRDAGRGSPVELQCALDELLKAGLLYTNGSYIGLWSCPEEVDAQIGVARLRKDDDRMGSPRRKHSREFKLEAVKQLVQQGRSVTEVADGLGINRNMLARWKAQLEQEGAVAFPGHGRRAETEAEAESAGWSGSWRSRSRSATS